MLRVLMLSTDLRPGGLPKRLVMLARALREGQIACTGIDVFETEPIPADNPLIGLPNCLLTSHVAGVASETTARIWDWAHDNVRAVVARGEAPRWRRN